MAKKKDDPIDLPCTEAKVDLDTKPNSGIEIKEKISRADMAKMISDDVLRILRNKYNILVKKLEEARTIFNNKLFSEVEKELKKFLTSFKSYAECRIESVKLQNKDHQEASRDGYGILYLLKEKGIIVNITIRFKEAFSSQLIVVHLPITCKAYTACKEEANIVDNLQEQVTEAYLKLSEFTENATCLKSDITKSMLGASANGQKILDGLEAVKAQILASLDKPKELT